MNLKTLVPTALLAATFAFALPMFAQTRLEPVADKKATPTESELIAKARQSYPLKKCVVSDEDLGSMGDAVAYVHHEAGKPDRVVFFCCEGCSDDFKKEPAKFLKKVDDAAANAKKGKSKDAAAKKQDR
jgi:hypothetical protein